MLNRPIALGRGTRESTPDSLAGRRVLVTGARGFLGSQLVARLTSAGAHVHGVSRLDPPGSGTVSWQQVDLCDPEASAQMIESVQPEFVFHLAGLTSAARDIDLVLPMLQSNLQATVNVLCALARTVPERVVLAGSLEEPGPQDPKTVPSSPYAVAKWASSGYARLFHDLWDLPVTSLRLAMIYGPGQRELHKLIPYVIGCLLDGSAPELTSGIRKIDWIYIDDVVEAFLAAAVASDAPGAAFDIGSGSTVAIGEIARLLTQMVAPGAEVRFGARPDRPGDTDWVAEIAAARRVLGWEPSVDLLSGLGRTVDWYRDLRRRGLPADSYIALH